MSRLIDADALIKNYIVDEAKDDSEVISRADINNAPTVDAVEAVGCRDCVNYHNSGEANGIGWCDIHSRIDALGEWDMWDENDFCSYGERKKTEGKKMKMSEETEALLAKAIQHYGADGQITVAIEEMAELTKELRKVKRGKTNIDNIAEVDNVV